MATLATTRTTAPTARPRNATPPIVTVYRGADGTIHHARCRRPMEFQGSRGRLELDFRCLACHEHVSVPEPILSRIPVAAR